MARSITPSLNRTVRLLPKDKASQCWTPMHAAAGCVIDATRRALVADSIAALFDAHLASSPTASFAAVSHGVRACNDSTTGMGAPFFVEAKGASIGEVYLFDGDARKDALLATLGDNIASHRVEAKGGLFVTLAKDADAEACYRQFAMYASNRAPVGYAGMGPCVPVATDATPQVDEVDALAEKQADEAIAAAEASATKESKRAQKRKAKLAKANGEAPVQSEPVQEAAAE